MYEQMYLGRRLPTILVAARVNKPVNSGLGR